MNAKPHYSPAIACTVPSENGLAQKRVRALPGFERSFQQNKNRRIRNVTDKRMVDRVLLGYPFCVRTTGVVSKTTRWMGLMFRFHP